MKQFVKTNVNRYKHLLHLKTLISMLESDFEKGIVADNDGNQIRMELDKIKKEFLRLRGEACEEFDLVDSDELTIKGYGPEEVLITIGEKITFADWFYRVMPRVALGFYYREYSPRVGIVSESSGIEIHMDEGRSVPFWDGPFSITYRGNDAENIVIKLVPFQVPEDLKLLEIKERGFYTPYTPKIWILRDGGEWTEETMPVEGLVLRPNDKFKLKSVTFKFQLS